MIGIDTNVLVRYATQDDPDQSALADDAISGFTESNPGFVGAITLAESVWVLRRVYRVDSQAVATFVSFLLDAREIVLEHPAAVRRSLAATSGDERFTDCLIAEIGADAGCEHTLTFDRRAAHLPHVRLLGTG